MTNRLKYRLKEISSEDTTSQNKFTQVSFTGERRLLPVGEINHIVDVGKEFDKERNNSSIYRLQGTVCPLFSNPLMNIGGTGPIAKSGNGLNTFNLSYFLKDQTSSSVLPATFIDNQGSDDLSYEESINLYLEEKDGWFGFTDPDIRKAGFCEYFDIEPTRHRFDLNSNINKNWELTITYPFDSDDTHYVVKDGLLLVDAQSVIVGGKPMVALGTSVQHGLENGDRVTITQTGSITYDNKTFTVRRLGLDNGDYKASYFVIDIDPTTPALPIGPTFSTNGRMRRIVSGEPSRYYLRKFKKILVNNDYEMYPLGFSRTIFSDMNYQFVINEDIDVEGLVDNLGRPLSELYATFVKTDSGVFGPVKSGLDLEDIGSNKDDVRISNVRQIHDGVGTSPFISHDTLLNEDNLSNDFNSKQWFYGDVVEYNRFTLKEVLLADVLHRFNTTDRENPSSGSGILVKGPRREGYLYKPHHLFKIREFSLYIEQGDENTGGIPNYAEYLGVNDGRYLWRDFLDIGVYDGEGEELDYPFTNGAHYLHQNFCFMTKRQDPFGNYNLYYEGTPGIPGVSAFDPADPRGDALTDNFRVKRSQDVC